MSGHFEGTMLNERELVRSVGRYLEDLGWSVRVEPRFGPSRPDLFAFRPNGAAVVIEFKTASPGPVHFASIAQTASFARLAEAYNEGTFASPVLVAPAAVPPSLLEAADTLGVTVLQLAPAGDVGRTLAREIDQLLPATEAASDIEWRRALLRIDEMSFNMEGALVTVDAAAAAKSRLDHALTVAAESKRPRDFELVHRYAVEGLGAAALSLVRTWVDRGARGSAVTPTPGRLPAMIDEVMDVEGWMSGVDPLATFRSELDSRWAIARSSSLDGIEAGAALLAVVGLCAGVAAWIRTLYEVGD